MSDFFDTPPKRQVKKKVWPTLYSRDTTGNIREWFLEQEENKYRTNSGVQGGQLVVSEWTTAKGKNEGKKNETTSTTQAIKEIQSKYKKQLESGYFDEVSKVDDFQYFQPMLAHKWLDHKDKVDFSKGVLVSPKLDGLRCVFTKFGAFSRNGKKFVSFPHIERELKPLFDKDPNLVLDGEIYTHLLKEDFDKIISLAKKTKPTSDDIVESEKHLQYWIFDYPSCSGDFDNRYNSLKKLILENFRDNKWIRLCIHKLIHSEPELETALGEWLQHGFEGAMLNLRDGMYLNKRSTNLLKYKLFQDVETTVINITEGVGNRSGMFGYATLKLSNGKTFDSNARGNEEQYKKILKNKSDYIGKSATIRFQNYTPDGIPRFPVIVQWAREDCE